MSPGLNSGVVFALFASFICLACVFDLWEAAFLSLDESIEVVTMCAKSVVLFGRVVLNSSDSGVAFVASEVEVFNES